MMLKKVLITIAFVSFIVSTDAQIKWPSITQTAKPWARWWWEGSAVNKKDLTANLQDYFNAGLGGMEITPIYGVHGYEKQFINFLSPQWMQMFDHTLMEAKRIGIGIDLANGTGWPFGGPTITDKEASKTIYYKTWQLNSGEQLQEPVIYKVEGLIRTANSNDKAPKNSNVNPVIAENKNLQDMALDQIIFPATLPVQLLMAYNDKGEKIDLTNKVDASGKLNWTASSGKWMLYGLFQGLHGKMVERAAPGGEGYAIDHFSADALHHYFKRFDDAFKGHDVSYIRALFNDSYEVDDARGQSNWTPNFLSEFKKRRGYGLQNYLPALFQKSDADMNSRVIFDYRTTIGELILEDFTQEWKKWGTTKGVLIRNQSHGSPGNLLDLYGAVDIPETEGNDVLRYKFATSVAHVMGKKFASSESVTWLNEHFTSSWGDVKKALDLYWLGGVNHIFYHGVDYSPKAEAWPGWLFYAAVHFQQTDPQWKDFHVLNEYVARTQTFLQAGKPDNDVLVYYPLADRYSDPGNAMLQHFDGMGKEFAGTDFQKISQWMLEHDYAFDFFSDKQLQNISGGKTLMTGGSNYQTILLPANDYISERSFQKIFDLTKNGATILVYKKLPKDVPGFSNLDKDRAGFKNMVNQLNFTDVEGIQTAQIGKGRFLLSDDMNVLLKMGGIRTETLHDQGLQFTRRKNTDGSTYLLSNRGNKKVNGWITLNAKASAVAMFDAMTAKSGLANWKINTNGTIDVMVQLKSFESIIVQLFNTKKTGNNFPYTQTTGEPQQLKGEWTLTFLNGGPSIPATAKINELGSWTSFEGDAYKNFSGTAKYATTFSRPNTKAVAYKLDLGKVNETAEIILNGKKLTTLIGPYFSVIIPSSDIKENNKLEIIIANLMANRIAYMDRNNIPWKKFYNTNMPARKRENSKNGLFDASNWEPMPSGLSGPVTITAVSYEIK
ncbi:MAG TPA: glycosyl hydrolase [Chitinophagaceae bacterium]